MNRIIRMVYGIVLVCAFLVAASVFVEYRLFNSVLKEELKKSLSLEKELVALSVESALNSSAQVIGDTSSFLRTADDEGQIRAYFETLLRENPEFSSVYFLSKDNKMINGSGWIPPAELDLRERPWYGKAVEEGKLIFTEAFLNASKDELIVTVAAPVKDAEGDFIGVTAGDLPVGNILSLVPSPGGFEDSFSFMTDGTGHILAYPDVPFDPAGGLKDVREISAELADLLSAGTSGLYEIAIDGKPGLVTYRAVEGTNWLVGSFIRIEGNLIPEKEMLPLFFVVIVPVVLLMIVLFFWQKTFIVKPIMALDTDIKAVSSEDDIGYRLPETGSDPFLVLRHTVNKVLDRISESFIALKETNDLLGRRNTELSSAMNQLRTVEAELRKQYESLYLSRAELKVSEEMNKAIVSALPDKIIRITENGFIFDCNFGEGRSEESGYPEENVRRLEDIMPEDAAEKALAKIAEIIKYKRPTSFNYQVGTGDRTEYFECRLVNIRNNEAIAIIRDVTEQRNNMKYIEFLSYNDTLSGLSNRRYFEEKLPQADVPGNLPLSVLMLDLNALKIFNDAFGHNAGDDVIRELAGIMRANCRDEDMIVRSGGDEFIVVMPRTDSDTVACIRNKIIKDASAKLIRGIPISVSVGHATKENKDQVITDIILKAEVELYREKLVESSEMKNRIIDRIVDILSDRDPKDREHFDRVSGLSRKLGEVMGSTETVQAELETAGFLHDIGKIAVVTDSTRDVSEFDDESTAGYRKHPETGYQILRSVHKYANLAEGVLYHHEKWNGSGFPRGLSGESIPLVARIIAVAEFTDACISGRSGLKTCSKAEAVSVLVSRAGIEFDPAVVSALQSISDDI